MYLDLIKFDGQFKLIQSAYKQYNLNTKISSMSLKRTFILTHAEETAVLLLLSGLLVLKGETFYSFIKVGSLITLYSFIDVT